jgi:hypothetical protein
VLVDTQRPGNLARFTLHSRRVSQTQVDGGLLRSVMQMMVTVPGIRIDLAPTSFGTTGEGTLRLAKFQLVDAKGAFVALDDGVKHDVVQVYTYLAELDEDEVEALSDLDRWALERAADTIRMLLEYFLVYATAVANQASKEQD